MNRFSEPCRHCHSRRALHTRRMCWTCYYAQGVRELYPSTSKFTKRGVGLSGGLVPAPSPTAALPGTPDKIEVLAARAAAGVALFHPGDAPYQVD